LLPKIQKIRIFYPPNPLTRRCPYDTYRNWEIGHRNPCTSAVSLLTLAEQNPKVFLKQQKQYENDKN
jgi:hypothetical protein